jgi:hypothetical protein
MGRAAHIGRTQILARTAALTIGLAAASVKLVLSAHASALAGSSAGPAGRVQILAISAVLATGRGAATFIVGLRSIAMTLGSSRSVIGGKVAIAARASAIGVARFAMTAAIALVGRSAPRSAGQAAPKGILTLTTASPSRSTNSTAKALYNVTLTTMSIAGRSIANSIALLVLKYALFVDPERVVQYPVSASARIARHGAGMPRAAFDFPPVSPTEQVVLGFDFSPDLAVGELLILGSTSVSIAVVSGVDATPSSRLIGTSSISGSFALQAIGGLQSGAIYNIVATVATSGTQILTLSAHQSCNA